MRLPDATGIKAVAGARVYERGRRMAGETRNLSRSGDAVRGEVVASSPYRILSVEAQVVDGAVTACRCDCGAKGACEHAVAVLVGASREMALGMLRQADASAPEAGAPHPDVAALRDKLAWMGKDKVVELLMARVEAKPAEARAILRGIRDRAAAPVDIDRIRDGVVRTILALPRGDEPRSAMFRGDWLMGFMDEAQRRNEVGDRRNEARTLVGILEGLVKGVAVVSEHNGHLSAIADSIRGAVHPLANRLLDRDLSAEDRAEYAVRLSATPGGISPIWNIGASLAVARRAVEAGWDAPDVADVLEGRAGMWATPEIEEAEKALLPHRQARFAEDAPEVARLGEAARTRLDRAADLVREGKQDEAVAYAQAQFTRSWQAQRLHDMLASRGQSENYVRLAEIGLGLLGAGGPDGARRDLLFAQSVRSTFIHYGPKDIAWRAAQAVFAMEPTAKEFGWLRRAAGDRWPEVREKAIGQASASCGAADLALILSSEHEGARAAEVYGDGAGISTEQLVHMLQEIGAEQPDWAAKAAGDRVASLLGKGGKDNIETSLDLVRDCVWQLVKASRFEDATRFVDRTRGLMTRAPRSRMVLDEYDTLIDNKRQAAAGPAMA